MRSLFFALVFGISLNTFADVPQFICATTSSKEFVKAISAEEGQLEVRLWDYFYGYGEEETQDKYIRNYSFKQNDQYFVFTVPGNGDGAILKVHRLNKFKVPKAFKRFLTSEAPAFEASFKMGSDKAHEALCQVNEMDYTRSF